MNIPISSRLKTCCGFVAPGDRVADIGTDHGYLGIWLLQQGIARSVIAADIAVGPLSAARINAQKYGFSDRMEFYLSDGVQSIPRDFDTMICAGMGADTMISILSAAPWLRSSQYRLILQCQSKTHCLRRYLSDNGWRIFEESVIKDGKFLYTVMEVIFQPGYTLSPGEWYFPPALLENPGAEVPEYYRRVTANLRLAVSSRMERAEPELITALSELEALPLDPNLTWLKEVSS